jgi:predicted chitinase
MDKKVLFDSLRSTAMFGGKLDANQVTGIELLVDTAIRRGLTNPHHTANVLAQVFHETGGYMLPIKETVMPSHKDKNPSDSTVIARLDKAFKDGKLTWVKTPYWKEGWFGRGGLQITHEKNYKKLGDAIGVDLVSNRDKALDPLISADIAVVGMQRGLFTGRKLGDYEFPAALAADDDKHPRRIVNGKDGTDSDIAKYHRAFYNALVKAGYSAQTVDPTKPATAPEPAAPVPTPVRTKSVIMAEIRALLDELESLGG